MNFTLKEKRKQRFDWVEMLTSSGLCYTQICFLLLYQIGIESEMYFIGSQTIPKKVLSSNPLPHFKYDPRDQYCLNKVDVISRPAFVVSESCLREDLNLADPNLRKKLVFTAVPYYFVDQYDVDERIEGLHFELTNEHDNIMRFCQSYTSGPKRTAKETDYYALVDRRYEEIEALQAIEEAENLTEDEDEDTNENDESNASGDEEEIDFVIQGYESEDVN